MIKIKISTQVDYWNRVALAVVVGLFGAWTDSAMWSGRSVVANRVATVPAVAEYLAMTVIVTREESSWLFEMCVRRVRETVTVRGVQSVLGFFSS